MSEIRTHRKRAHAAEQTEAPPGLNPLGCSVVALLALAAFAAVVRESPSSSSDGDRRPGPRAPVRRRLSRPGSARGSLRRRPRRVGGRPGGGRAEQAEVDEPDQRERGPGRAGRRRRGPSPASPRSGSAGRSASPRGSSRRGRREAEAAGEAEAGGERGERGFADRVGGFVVFDLASFAGCERGLAARRFEFFGELLRRLVLAVGAALFARFLGRERRLRLCRRRTGRRLRWWRRRSSTGRDGRGRAAPTMTRPTSCGRTRSLRAARPLEEEEERRREQEEADRLQDAGEGHGAELWSWAERRISASPSPLTPLIARPETISSATARKVASRHRHGPAASQSRSRPCSAHCSAPLVEVELGQRPCDRSHGPYATAHEQRTAHPRRPARGRRRPREPPLPRLRRAALRLARDPARPGTARSAAARAAGSASSASPAEPEEALRELDRLGGEGDAADRQPRQLRRLARQRRLGRAGAGRPLPVHGRVGAAARRPPRPGREVAPLGAAGRASPRPGRRC